MPRIEAVYAAPIPVGHRVEITWYSEPDEGGFFSKGAKDFPYAPLIKDLDTQIEYATDVLFEGSGGQKPNEPYEMQDDIKVSLEVDRQLTGTVLRCRVITVCWSEQRVQTHLWIKQE